MIKLLNAPYKSTCETDLIIQGLRVFSVQAGIEQDLYVYGGLFRPGENYDSLLESYNRGDFLGLCGLTIPEDAVVAWPASLRAALGAVLQLAPEKYMADQLSVDWSSHFGFQASLGGHPGWLAEQVGAPLADKTAVVSTVGGAIAAALRQEPCILHVTHDWGISHRAARDPLVRWAAAFGVPGNLVYNEAELTVKLQDGSIELAAPEKIDAAKDTARRTLDLMVAAWLDRKAAVGTKSILVQALGNNPTPTAVAPLAPAAPGRELVLGSKFDPATHYTDEYFAAGIRYTKPDGTVETYHGPGHDWGGFATAARFLRAIVPGGLIRLLDLGCGSGAFVRQAVNAGFDAYGADISEAAIRSAGIDIRGRLLQQDLNSIEKYAGDSAHDSEFDIVTALDFWEHIFLADIPRLISVVKSYLRPGGLGFFIICTRGRGEKDFTAKLYEEVTRENSWLLVSGHVTLRRWKWWAHKFLDQGFALRGDLESLFQVLASEDPGFRGVESWRARNLLIVERR